MVGTSGNACVRVAPVTASASNLPVLMYSIVSAGAGQRDPTPSPRRAPRAGAPAPQRPGTTAPPHPLPNNCQTTCDVEPTAADVTVSASGLAFVAAISSGTDRAENAGCTTSTFIARIMLATGAVSRRKLNLRSV